MKKTFVVSFILCFLTPRLVLTQVLSSSNLPLVKIDTDGQTIDRETKIMANMKIINNGIGNRNNVNDPANEYDGWIGIEYRGNSSFDLFEKKSFGIETRNEDGSNLNISLLGMPEENDWVLYGPFSDKTLIRNALAYSLARDIMDYSPRTTFVEVTLNGDYQGVYMFTEKIKRDNNRVDISKLTEEDIAGEQVTGGYILKFDKASVYSNEFGFPSFYKPYNGAWQDSYFLFHYPKPGNILPQQKQYIENHIRDFEEILAGDNFDDPELGYRQWIDVQSFVDYFIINELSKNPDAYRLSTYFYKDRDDEDGRIKKGPVWDYNLAFGNVNYCTDGHFENFVVKRFNFTCPDDQWVIHFWWKRLLSDKYFTDQIKERWEILRSDVFSNARLNAKVDSLENIVAEAQMRNFQLYPNLNEWVWPNFSVEGSFDGEVERLKDWLIKRALWIDNGVEQLEPSDYDPGFPINPQIFPNPLTEESILQFYSHQNAVVSYDIFDLSGKRIISRNVENKISGLNQTNLYPELNPGLYVLHLRVNDNEFHFKILKD